MPKPAQRLENRHICLKHEINKGAALKLLLARSDWRTQMPFYFIKQWVELLGRVMWLVFKKLMVA